LYPGSPPGGAAAWPSRRPRSGRRSGRPAALRPGTEGARGACRSCRWLLAPDDANGLQLAGHGPPRAVKPRGDLVLGEALHLPDGDLAQARVAEQVQQSLVLLRNLGRKLRRGLVAHHLLEGGLVPSRLPGVAPRLAWDSATTATPAVLVGKLVEGLA